MNDALWKDVSTVRKENVQTEAHDAQSISPAHIDSSLVMDS